MRVTVKGQVTIPRAVRESMGIVPETEVDFIEESGRYYLTKVNKPTLVKNINKLRGIASVHMTTDEIMQLTRQQR